MFESKKNHGTGCPIAFALDAFGDRWSLLIVRDLMLQGSETYGDFLNAGEGIATNILADRLKHLESADIIQKSRDPDNRRRYLYKLTERGRDLVPIILEFIRWGAKYDPEMIAQKEKVKKIEEDYEALLAEIHTPVSRKS